MLLLLGHLILYFVCYLHSIKVAEARQGRWDKLNTVLDINEKAKPKEERYRNSYVAWDQVKQFFNVVLGTFPTSAGGGLPQALLTALHEYLSLATICFGSITDDHQPKRVHFIAPIIIMVCSYFNGDVQVLAEEDIEGFHFDFVLKRGDKRLCIVEAKKDDILQGKTESLIACESLCNAEGLPVAYGIATNYLEWCFLKSEAHQVTEEMVSVWFQNNRMTIESLRNVASKIIAILE